MSEPMTPNSSAPAREQDSTRPKFPNEQEYAKLLLQSVLSEFDGQGMATDRYKLHLASLADSLKKFALEYYAAAREAVHECKPAQPTAETLSAADFETWYEANVTDLGFDASSGKELLQECWNAAAARLVPARPSDENAWLRMKLGDADKVMAAIDHAVKCQHLSARSEIADARQNYSEPFEYVAGNPHEAAAQPQQQWISVETKPNDGRCWIFVRGIGWKTGAYRGALSRPWEVRDSGSQYNCADEEVAGWAELIQPPMPHSAALPSLPITRESQK